jgi:uncharacterized protein (TIGR03067 family)
MPAQPRYRRTLVVLCLLVTALPSSAAPAPLPRREKGEKESLEGEWQLIEERSRGMGGPRLENVVMTIRGRALKIQVQPGGETMEAEFTFSAGAGGYPRTIDLRSVRYRFGGQVMEEKGRTSLGLYRLQGNTLTLSVGSENKRPASLEDGSAQVMVFTRVRR